MNNLMILMKTMILLYELNNLNIIHLLTGFIIRN